MQESRQLYRSREDSVIGGVCGGLAEYFDLDPSIVRLLAVVIAIIGNVAAVIAYIVMWAVVPEQPLGDTAGTSTQASQPPPATTPSSAAAPPPASARHHATTPAPAMSPDLAGGIRSGLIWLGAFMVVVGAVVLADRLYPGLNLWGIWPATVLGLLFIAGGVRTMFTREDDDR